MNMWSLVSKFTKPIFMVYCYNNLNKKLLVSWKVHCVRAHLEDVLSKLQQGLALYAEQTGEGAHWKMELIMDRHHRSEDHKDHGQSQLTAVCKFASWNLKSITNLKRNKDFIKE